MENSESTSTSSFKKIFLYPIILALLLGSSSPWWWDRIFSAKTKPVVTDSTGKKLIDTTNNKTTTDPLATTTESITVPVNKFGVWGSSRQGDNEMDTEKNKYWQVECISKLTRTKSDVSLQITYRVWEDKNDHRKTAFANRLDTIIYHAPRGKKISGLNATESPLSFEASGEGPNHSVNKFGDIHGTYWNDLRFKVDGLTRDDSKTIGIQGQLKLSITLANL